MGDVARIELEFSVPVELRLPPQDTAAAPVDVKLPMVFPEVIDLAQSLRDAGRDSAADSLEETRNKIVSVSLVKVEYEVLEPNGLRADISPVILSIAPADSEDPVAEGRQLGSTIRFPRRLSIAKRELDYVEGGRAFAGPLLAALRFTLVADTVLSVPAGIEIKQGQFVLRLQMKLVIVMDLAL